MGSANRVQVSYVKEVTRGVTPNTPAMKLCRITGESLAANQEFVDSDELRADRMTGDPIRVMGQSGGGINFEFSYPTDNTFLSDMLASAMESAWVNTPTRDNAGTADSVITDIGTTADTITFTTGAAYAIGHLVRTTGFTNAANNKIVRVTTGGATSLVATGSGFTAEAAPPGTARVKVVGFRGVAGDITCTASGLGATTLNFTTLGLAVGQVIKIGGSAVGERFATSANNAYARITAISATALTLDNLPTGWAVDAGTGKTISVWFGDQIKNGTTPSFFSIEKGFLDQTTPTYIVNKGMSVGTMNLEISAKDKIKGSFTFFGTGYASGTTALDASPDPASTTPIMAANVNFSRMTEGGVTVGAPNFIKSLSINLNNNLRYVEDISVDSPANVLDGECTVTGRAETYFGSNALLTKFYNNTPTSYLFAVNKANQTCVFQVPRATYNGGGNPQATAKNTDVMASFEYKASLSQDGTSAHIIMDRMEYVES